MTSAEPAYEPRLLSTTEIEAIAERAEYAGNLIGHLPDGITPGMLMWGTKGRRALEAMLECAPDVAPLLGHIIVLSNGITEMMSYLDDIATRIENGEEVGNVLVVGAMLRGLLGHHTGIGSEGMGLDGGAGQG